MGHHGWRWVANGGHGCLRVTTDDHGWSWHPVCVRHHRPRPSQAVWLKDLSSSCSPTCCRNCCSSLLFTKAKYRLRLCLPWAQGEMGFQQTERREKKCRGKKSKKQLLLAKPARQAGSSAFFSCFVTEGTSKKRKKEKKKKHQHSG